MIPICFSQGGAKNNSVPLCSQKFWIKHAPSLFASQKRKCVNHHPRHVYSITLRVIQLLSVSFFISALKVACFFSLYTKHFFLSFQLLQQPLLRVIFPQSSQDNLKFSKILGMLMLPVRGSSCRHLTHRIILLS